MRAFASSTSRLVVHRFGQLLSGENGFWFEPALGGTMPTPLGRVAREIAYIHKVLLSCAQPTD